MKYYTFKRESNKFDDILKDPTIKKYIATKIAWDGHLMLGLSYSAPESIYGYLVLKYGDCIYNPYDRNFTPVPGRDYLPKRR